MSADAPSLQAIRSLREALGNAVYRTPVTRCAALEPEVGGTCTIWGKLEFLQVTGTFKARGALSNLKTLDSAQLAAGVLARPLAPLDLDHDLFSRFRHDLFLQTRACATPGRCAGGSYKQ